MISRPGMKCARGCQAFCCRCFDCTSLVRRGKKRGLTEEDAAVEVMEHKEEVEDVEEKDVPKMEGYLEKKGKSRLVSSWRKYWFVLEGRRLTYYESQPQTTVELPPSCKGSLTLAPATSVTASKQASNNGAGNQLSYLEIYILNSSRLIVLRTKDADQHTSWLKALVASSNLPVKSPPTNGSKSSKSTGTKNVFPLRSSISTSYFHNSLTNLSSQEGKKTNWPKKVAHTMDSRSCSLYQRKSGSMDDILDRYADQANKSGKDGNVSDSEEEDSEDSKSKAVSPESEDQLILQSPLEYRLPVAEQELSSARLYENREKDLVQKKEDIEELSALAIEEWDKIHPSTYADENYKAENDLTKYIELQGTRSGKQSETHEGKVKARRFLTSLVPKDSKIFEGIYKSEKTSKKEKHLASSDKKEAVNQLAIDKNEKPKVKQKKMSVQTEAKERQNDIPRAQKTISLNDASQSGCSVRNSIMKRTSEFRTARRAKRNKDKKKSESDETNSKDISHEPCFSRQNSQKDNVFTATPLLEESDMKKKRRRMGFLTKMLRGKKSDDQEVVVIDKYGILEDQPFESASSPVRHSSHYSDFTEEESSPQPNPAVVMPHLSFGLKLFPVDDAELRKKLESRMARIESEMALMSENEKLADSYRITDASNIPPAEDADLKSMEEIASSPPPVLPPRLIKLTPPTPPAHAACQEDESLGDRSPDLLEGFLQGISSKDFTYSTNSSESNQRKRTSEEVILCERDESGWKGMSQNRSELGCDQSAVTLPGILPVTLNDNAGKEGYGPKLGSGVCRTEVKVSDMRGHPDYGASGTGEHGTSPRMSWENGSVRPLSGDSVQRTQSDFTENFNRTGVHVDELSLLLTELDRINASPIHQDVSRSNHRPISDEVKKVSTFEEDYITAFPIRRRRNSDPDYDIPRPHRIPRLQETKEEIRVDPPPLSTQQPERKSSSRENTDSIVIEATRFFGPGMDFSFNEKKYSTMKDNEDFWNYPYDSNTPELNCECPDYIHNDNSKGSWGSKGDSEFLSKTVQESSEPSISQVSADERVSGTDEPKTVCEEEDSALQLRNILEVTGDSESDVVVLRSSNIDRACRKERSREIYEEDLTDQFKLNDLLEGLSISSTLPCTSKPPETLNEGGSGSQTLIELDTNEFYTLGSLDQEASQKSNQDFCKVEGLEIPELNDANITMSNGPASDKTVRLDTLPDSITASAIEEGAGHENLLDDHENEVVLRSKPEGSSREDNKAYRLSFATTETLLVEEEVLVATLKTTTTTTTLLPLEDGSIHESRENVEEFVEETILDMDQLSDDQFDSMQVHSCVQT